MKIGIDISTILNHGIDIGSGRYIYNLIKHLILLNCQKNSDFEQLSNFKQFSKHCNKNKQTSSEPIELILTARYTTDENLHILEDFKNLIKSHNPKKPHKKSPAKLKLSLKLFKTTPKILKLWDKFRFPPIEMLGFKADILHCPDFLIPPTLNKNIILTINDLAFIRFPQFNFEWFIKKYTNEVKKNALRSKKIIAISNSTKQDIVHFFNINENKIYVTHLAADEIFRKLKQDEIDRSVLEKFKINKKFILSVGTIEPRKNYPKLIKAFNLLKEQINSNANLDANTGLTIESSGDNDNTNGNINIDNGKASSNLSDNISDNIVGNTKKNAKDYNIYDIGAYTSTDITTDISTDNNADIINNKNDDNNGDDNDYINDYMLVIAGRIGWKSESTFEEYNKSPYKNDIIFTGRITDEELLNLYNLAEIFVYPSFFEGFGLPIVEAMNCGLPVCASNCSSIPEIVSYKNYKEVLFNPENENEIAQKILKVLKDKKIKQQLSEESEELAKNFNWQKTASQTLKIYEEICKDLNINI